MTKSTETTAPKALNCKELADAIYSRKGNLFVLAGGMKLKTSKLPFWNDLMTTPEGVAPFRLLNQEADDGVAFEIEAIL